LLQGLPLTAHTFPTPIFSALDTSAEKDSHIASRWQTGSITPPLSSHEGGAVSG
jgi:hypothetical protein